MIYTINKVKEVAPVDLYGLARVKRIKMTVKQIVEYVVIFLSSGLGATILGLVIRSIALAVANTKAKKYSKLTEDDKNAIAKKVEDDLFNRIQGTLTLDADAIVDKATNSRLSALEDSYNDIAKAVNLTTEYARATMNAVGDFKTISEDSRTIIKKLLSEDVAKVDEVQPEKVAAIKIETKDTKPQVVEEKAVSKISY